MNVIMNGQPVPLPDGGTLADLIEARVASTRGIAAAVDGVVVPRDTWDRTVLRDGQSVEVLTAVQGG